MLPQTDEICYHWDYIFLCLGCAKVLVERGKKTLRSQQANTVQTVFITAIFKEAIIANEAHKQNHKKQTGPAIALQLLRRGVVFQT